MCRLPGTIIIISSTIIIIISTITIIITIVVVVIIIATITIIIITIVIITIAVIIITIISNYCHLQAENPKFIINRLEAGKKQPVPCSSVSSNVAWGFAHCHRAPASGNAWWNNEFVNVDKKTSGPLTPTHIMVHII